MHPDDTDVFAEIRRLDDRIESLENRRVNILWNTCWDLLARIKALEKMHEKSRGQCVSVHSVSSSVPSGNPDMSG